MVKIDIPKEKLKEMYVGEKLYIREIADIYNCGFGTIQRRLNEYEIPIRHSSKFYRYKEMNIKFKKNIDGENNPNWKGGISDAHYKLYKNYDWFKKRNEIIKRADGKCELCKDDTNKFNIHHIIPTRMTMNVLSSPLMALCIYCHTEIHKLGRCL